MLEPNDQVHRRELCVGGRDVERGDLRFRRQIGAHLVHARADVAEGVGRGEIESQTDVDGRKAELTLRFDVVDTIGGGDGSLERRGDEAADEVGVGADVDRLHGDRRALDLRVLPYAHAADRLKPSDEDDQVDDDREDGTSNEDVGEPQGVSSAVHRMRRQLGMKLCRGAHRHAACGCAA